MPGRLSARLASNSDHKAAGQRAGARDDGADFAAILGLFGFPLRPRVGETCRGVRFFARFCARRCGPEIAAHSQPEKIQWPRPYEGQLSEPGTLLLRVEGPAAIEVQHPETQETLLGKGEMLDEDVLDEAGVLFEADDEEQEVAQFRQFLDEVTPEDFAQ